MHPFRYWRCSRTVDLASAIEEDLLTPPPWLLSSVEPSLTWSIHVGDSLNRPIVIAISIASIQRLDHRPFEQVRCPGLGTTARSSCSCWHHPWRAHLPNRIHNHSPPTGMPGQ
ncbi:hypothetical protein BDV39DRAFT_3309 [Aspergillus sergii]|uniref:Uncharacterized protein n=1 Tax=Aspergillus sergii TaxID=1034303 RepID=A0A5N6XNN3_9EURO|nr:hypothetical protein BDV39DRAFT_3309 [Aspergillus sergii]